MVEEQSFHDAMDRSHVRALWEGAAHGKRRIEIEPAWQWRWAEIAPLVARAVNAVSMEDAERRVLAFMNPHYAPERTCATLNLTGAVQILLPGERARPHRHSMNALRFILQGSGARTIVDGKSCPMEEGDLILTPAWTWHEHIHDGDGPVVWFDLLDGPLQVYLGTAAFESGPASNMPPTVADEAFSAPGMVPAEALAGVAGHSPLFRYGWRDARAAVDRLPAGADGARLLRYVNPMTGLAVMSLVDCYLLGLDADRPTAPAQAASNIVCIVVEGEGRSQIGDRELRWSRNDVFTVPRSNRYMHEASSGGAKLFLATDREVLRRLGLLDAAQLHSPSL